MRKLLFLIVISGTLLASCKKNQAGNPSTQANKLTGKWAFLSVTTHFTDPAGNDLHLGATYPNPPNSYYQFNNDGTWMSKFVADTSASFDYSGFYKAITDTSFTIYNTGQYAYSEVCKIDSLSPHSFIFRHKKNTFINGVTPVILEYIFRLTK